MFCVWSAVCFTASRHASDEAKMVSWCVSAQTWIRESAQLPDNRCVVAVCWRWMQGCTMSQRFLIGFRIALMPSLSRTLQHSNQTRQCCAPEGTQVCLETSRGVRCHYCRKYNTSQERIEPFSSRACFVNVLFSPPVDCPIYKTAGETDALLLPTWTGWPLKCGRLGPTHDDSVLRYFFVQIKRRQTRWAFSSCSCCWCSLFTS